MTTQTSQWLGPRIIIGESVSFDLPSAANMKVNHKRILNEDDLLGSGIQTIDAFGSAPNASGASIPTAGHLQLQPADASNPGGLSTVDQTLPHGVKTFQDDVISKKRLRFDDATSASVGVAEFGQTAKKARLTAHTQAPNGTKNLYFGEGAGNFTSDAQSCVGIGKGTLSTLAHGSNLVALGENISVGTGTDTLMAPGNASALAGEVDGCVLLGTGPTADFDTLRSLREKETWIGRFNQTGGDLTERVRVAGVSNSSYEYNFSTAKPVLCTPDHIITSYPYWPGTAAGPFFASVGAMNVASGAAIQAVPLDSNFTEPLAPQYVTRSGNQVTILKSGIYFIKFSAHCSSRTTLRLICDINGGGVGEECHYSGEPIPGSPNSLNASFCFHLQQNDVISFEIVGVTNDASNWTISTIGSISLTHVQHVE